MNTERATVPAPDSTRSREPAASPLRDASTAARRKAARATILAILDDARRDADGFVGRWVVNRGAE